MVSRENDKSSALKRLRYAFTLAAVLAAVALKLIFPGKTAEIASKIGDTVSSDWNGAGLIERIKGETGAEDKAMSAASAFFRRLLNAGEDSDESQPIRSQSADELTGYENAGEKNVHAAPLTTLRFFSPADFMSAIARPRDGEYGGAGALAAPGAAESEEDGNYTDMPVPDDVREGYVPLGFSCRWPLAGEITSPFGYREHPVTGNISFHYGVDIAAAEGEAVSTFSDGAVEDAGCDEVYGNYLLIGHSGGAETFYAHLSDTVFAPGDSVKAGQTVAHAGSTGLSTGPHLHFEVRKAGKNVDPMYYFPLNEG